MSLVVDVHHRLGGFHLDATFESSGRVTALFGASGAGKTSLVNVIAGLLKPQKGRVVVDGRTLVDTGQGICAPRHRRRIGYVFQEGRLFPHLSVRHNLLYGWRFAPRAEPGAKVADVIDLLGLGTLLGRHPAALSGGEKQRVAIGRALLAKPRLLLMDEPLASLDDARKQEILPYIERLRDFAGVPIVYVSHAMPEILRLATDLAVMSGGKLVAAGPLQDVLGRIELLSLTGYTDAGSVIDAQIRAHDTAFDLTTFDCAAGSFDIPKIDAAVGTTVRLRIQARDVLIARHKPEGLSARNVLQGVVAQIHEHGPMADLALDCAGTRLLARITRKSAADLALAPGQSVYAVIKAITFDRRNVGATTGPEASDL